MENEVALRRRAGIVTVVGVLVWLMANGWLRVVWPGYAGRWAIGAGLALVYVGWILWRNLPANHRQGETAVLPTLGLGNGLTLFRGLAIALLTGFLFAPWPEGFLAWLPALLYMTADIADYFDGYAARVTHHATRLGEILDMEIDGLGVLIVTLLAVWYGQLPWWFLALGLSRYLFVFGLWLRRRRGLPVYDMPPSVHRRNFAGFYMGFLSAVLWPIVPPAGATIAGALFGGATAVSFLRDWLAASGQINPASDSYRRQQRHIYRTTTHTLPPLLRLTLAVCLAAIAAASPMAAWAALFTGWGLPGAVGLAVFWLAVMAGAGTAVFLGIIPRTASLLLVFPLGFDMVTRDLAWANGAGLACAIAIMLLGGGALSLWRPEERFMVRRAGEIVTG